MTDIHLAVEMTFVGTPRGTDEQFEAFLDEVYAQLGTIGREVNLAARLRDRVADFATSIEADSYEDAVVAFLADLRTALHAAGGSTAGWPRFEPTGRTVRELADA
jgi:hypothetical protein